MGTNGPSLHDYPGYFPAKPRFYKRRWLQLVVVGLVTFVLGVAVGGAPTATSDPEPERAVASISQSDVDAAVEEAVDDAVSDEQAAAQDDLDAQRSTLQGIRCRCCGNTSPERSHLSRSTRRLACSRS